MARITLAVAVVGSSRRLIFRCTPRPLRGSHLRSLFTSHCGASRCQPRLQRFFAFCLALSSVFTTSCRRVYQLNRGTFVVTLNRHSGLAIGKKFTILLPHDSKYQQHFMPERKDNHPLEGESVGIPYVEVESVQARDGEDTRTAWSRYRHKNIPLTGAFMDTERRLKDLASSPLMPEECAALLQDYIDLLSKNAGHLAQELEKIAQELPDRWPDVSRILPMIYSGAEPHK
jgi:hypothetical protein